MRRGDPDTTMSEDTSNPSPAHGVFSRRAVLKVAAVGIVGAGIGGGSAALVTRFSRSRPRPYRFFNHDEAALVIEICEQLIPRDDAPGATEAGVIRYIDRQLAGPLARHQPDYRRGLESLRETCAKEFGLPFAQLSAEQKLDLLRRVETGKVPAPLWRESPAPQFFRLVLSHAMQGFYGPERHGGNRGYLSYRMLGLSYPQVIGQNRYPAQP